MDDGHRELVDALMAAGCTVKGRAVTCAFHGDRTSSGSIYESPDGRYRYKCHGCAVAGDAADIIAAHTGRPLGEVLKAQRPTEAVSRPVQAPKPTFPTLDALIASMSGVVEVYRYTNPDTQAVELAVIRKDPKSFPQAHPVGQGWQFGGVPNPQPLYNRFRLRAAPLVVVCEGEKDCHALHALGIVATTAPMGADTKDHPLESDGKPGHADWSPLAGKRVVLWGDSDEPGRRHLERVARILGRLDPAPHLSRVRYEDLGGNKDAADLIGSFQDEKSAIAAVRIVLENATPVHASSVLRQRLEDAISGKLKSIGWPWVSVDRMTQALIPGAVTVLVGNPGATKSFMVLQAALWWMERDIPFALYEMEEDMAFWLGRAVAVHSETGALTSLEWVAQNAAVALSIEDHCRPTMDRLAQRITTAPQQGATMEQLSEWVEAQTAAGKRVLVIDPITAALEGDEKTHIAAQKFMLRAKRACERHGSSLVLTTHGRKQDSKAKGPPDLDSIAGGAAFARFASTVIWLEPSAEDEDAVVMTAAGEIHTATINRRLRILKARSGRGTGHTIGLRFDGHTLNAKEVGVLVSAKKVPPISDRPTRAERLKDKPAANENPF